MNALWFVAQGFAGTTFLRSPPSGALRSWCSQSSVLEGGDQGNLRRRSRRCQLIRSSPARRPSRLGIGIVRTHIARYPLYITLYTGSASAYSNMYAAASGVGIWGHGSPWVNTTGVGSPTVQIPCKIFCPSTSSATGFYDSDGETVC